MRLLFTLSILLAACAGAFASCPTPPTNDTIDVAAYMGLWYEIANSKSARMTFEHDLVCETANYTLNNDGSVTVGNSGRKLGVNGTLEVATGARQVQAASRQVRRACVGAVLGHAAVRRRGGL